MTKAKTDPLVWVDCEMTGLDLEKDELIEIAVIVTDFDLQPLDSGIDLLIKPSESALNHMGEFVREMHTKSGLLAELDSGLSIEEASQQVLDYVKRFVPEAGKAPLAGNSVGTDKTFLQKQMPDLVGWLHYRIVDVSSIKELASRWFPRVYGMAPEKFGNHRALGDIQDSINELRYYRAALFPNGDGPSADELSATAKQVTETSAFKS
ncbi:MAG: oligoribonuclease [Mobiluncus porci]|uniref:Oligoribonuclease n=1 Tax=Mobiluncus porci TaxID=2652278 RepID=A0A7K0K457_9ACTO|nr:MULTISPECIES: oligoribonuclease [Mobiluncus]MCI6583637.1 oligoribonuclease [Mobiluncus sp.]MDD7541220.1 oligoribonuclease [Mobiluncus porci]MDY5748110.1 oligoribonuclease [Mobiluncus porci]MST50219.1 oligoribonuclease [Mobiluncus porci]